MRKRSIYPVFRYADAKAAIDWLVVAFDFVIHDVTTDATGIVVHAELTYGDDMIMLAQAEVGQATTAEAAEGAAGTPPAADDWRVYVAVDDIEAHYKRAKAAGAEIVREVVEQPYGSHEYDARDLEGNVWSFGTYRP